MAFSFARLLVSKAARAWFLIALLLGQEAISVRVRTNRGRQSSKLKKSEGIMEVNSTRETSKLDASGGIMEVLRSTMTYNGAKYITVVAVEEGHQGLIMRLYEHTQQAVESFIRGTPMKGRPAVSVYVDPDAGVGINSEELTLIIPANGASRGLVLSYADDPTVQRPVPQKGSTVRVHVGDEDLVGTIREVNENGWFFVGPKVGTANSVKKVDWFDVSQIATVDAKLDPTAALLSRQAAGQGEFLFAMERTIRSVQRHHTCFGSTCFVQCAKDEAGKCWPPRLCQLSSEVGRSGNNMCKAVEGDEQMTAQWTALLDDAWQAAANFRLVVVINKETHKQKNNEAEVLANFVQTFRRELVATPSSRANLQARFPKLANALIADSGRGPAKKIVAKIEAEREFPLSPMNLFMRRAGCDLPKGAFRDVADESFWHRTPDEISRYQSQLMACESSLREHQEAKEDCTEKECIQTLKSIVEDSTKEYRQSLVKSGVDIMVAEELASQKRMELIAEEQGDHGFGLVELGSSLRDKISSNSTDGGALAMLAVGAACVAIVSFALLIVLTVAGWLICSMLAAPEAVVRRTFAAISPRHFGTREAAQAKYRLRVMQCSCVVNYVAAAAGIVGVIALVVLAAACEAEIAGDFAFGTPTAGDWFFLAMGGWDSPGIAFDPFPSPPPRGVNPRQHQMNVAQGERSSYDFLKQWIVTHRTSPTCTPACPNNEDPITLQEFEGPIVRSASTSIEPADRRILTLDGNEPRCYEIESLIEWLKLQKIDPLSRTRLTLSMIRDLIERPPGEPAGGCVPGSALQ